MCSTGTSQVGCLCAELLSVVLDADSQGETQLPREQQLNGHVKFHSMAS